VHDQGLENLEKLMGKWFSKFSIPW